MSPVYDEENKNVSIFTQLFGMKQEKVIKLWLLEVDLALGGVVARSRVTPISVTFVK